MQSDLIETQGLFVGVDGFLKKRFLVIAQERQWLLTSVPFLLVLRLNEVRFFLRVEFLNEL